ncbi:MAG: DUF3604 domain-containing protein [Parachlamydiaceae bacterium]|nr:DUF3604 domain-containing protein [Parachlamydiaceae bacterium]
MRRSICYCNPSSTLAGKVNTWKFTYTAAVNLAKGTKLTFDLESSGRDIDWQIPTSDLKEDVNVIYGKYENGKVVPAKEIEIPDRFTPKFEFVLPTELPAGSSFFIIIGSPKDNPATAVKCGTRAQTTAQRRRTFSLVIEIGGKGKSKTKTEEEEIFTMDIRGSELCNIAILTPSFVVRNKRFDAMVRFEDQYGNLTSEAPPETLIELSYEHLRENLNWKLFVPETGFISLPNLYFNEPGFYTIKLLNTHTKKTYYSSPIKCFPETSTSLFWGLLHGESERIDSTENIENCLRYFRDDKAYNFFASSPFESVEETSLETWKSICQHLSDFDEADRFTAMVGFQWKGDSPQEGLRQIIYAKDSRTLLRKKEAKYSTVDKIYKSFAPKELISIPSFTMGKGMGYDFHDYNPDFERLIEIYNAWGSSECSKKEGNLRPISAQSKKGVQEFPSGSIQKALLRNCRFGFVAGGLDDRGAFAELFDSDQEQYSPGLTAIIANEHSRSALFDALYNRSCYATTGARIIVGFNLASYKMGSETSTAQKYGFLSNRHLHGFVAGTTNLEKVEIIRNGIVIKTFTPNKYEFEFSYDDMDSLANVALDAKDKKPPFVFYYLRVLQADGHMAWSSPIWVDYIPVTATGKSTIKLRPAKAPKPLLDFSEDDLSEELDLEEDESDIPDED